jgi:hypothetical protein
MLRALLVVLALLAAPAAASAERSSHAWWRTPRRVAKAEPRPRPLGPLAQVLRGTFVDGPKELWRAVRRHPIRTCAVLAGAIGVSTLAGFVGLPIDAIALAASAGLTLKAIHHDWPTVKRAFRAHRANRWRLAGEDLLFPATAFAAGVGMGAVVEGAAGVAEAGLGLDSPALAVGLKSTAQSLDDLVPIAAAAGGEQRR